MSPCCCSPWCHLQFFSLPLLLRLSAAPIIGGMGFSSSCQPTVAACLGGRCIPILGPLLVQVSTPSPQGAGRLLTVCPHVDEPLAVVALCKTILSSICLYPDCDVADVLQWEKFLGFCHPQQGYCEKGGGL
jgi:hypothetical protein